MSSVKGYFLEALGKVVPVAPTLISTVLSPVKSGVPLAYEVHVEANYLLGKLDKTIATFSFDGNDAGKIVLASRFDGSGVRWDYSLDGKQMLNHSIDFLFYFHLNYMY